MIDLSVAVFGTATWMGTLTILWILRQHDPGGNLRSLRLYFLVGWVGWTIVLVVQMVSVMARTNHVRPRWLDALEWMLHEELSFSFAVMFMPIQATATMLLIYALLRPRVIPVIPVAVAEVTIDVQGTIVEWNEAAEHLLGWTAAEIMGKALATTIIPEEYRQAHLDGMERFRQTGEAPLLNKKYPVVALCKNGERTPTIDFYLTSKTDAAGTQYFVGQLTSRQPLI